jgi:CDP-2,3-bis-(O-geranylgeranyl)-sn-glycerol synthase
VLKETLFVLWFLLPAGAANMAPVLAKKWHWLSSLDKPVDGGRSWRGHRLLGDHKTWRGFAAGWLLALGLALLQFWLYDTYQSVRDFYLIDISPINVVVWATALSLGALGGDAIKSFFKRQIDVAPGKNWVPFDQLDFVIGTFIAVSFFVDMPLRFYVIGLALGLFLHPLVNLLGWVLQIKDKPF